MYAKKNKKPMYGKGGMAKLARYMKGGRIYAENGDRVPESSADPLKSPQAQAAINRLLDPYRGRIQDLSKMRAEQSDSILRRQLTEMMSPSYSALRRASQGDVDVLRSLISMEPTNREEAEQKAKAIEFAQSVSDEYAREMGTPVRNPLYNFFGLEGGPSYRSGGTVKYRSGGMMKYENGGPIDQAGESEVKVMVKDSYNTATNPQPGQDYIIMVEGQPTDYAISDMPNFFRSEGLGGPQLETTFYEFLDQFPKGSRSPEEEQAYRQEQFNKSLKDVAAIARGDGDKVETVVPGTSSRYDLGKRLKMVRRGEQAVDPDRFSFESDESKMKFAPTGQKGTPKGINTDDFLRVLATQFNR